MSRAIFIGRCQRPHAEFTDAWICKRTPDGIVSTATVDVKLALRWIDMQVAITKTTTDDFVRIALKLRSFFDEQLKSTRLAWTMVTSKTKPAPSSVDDDDPSSSVHHRRLLHRHWVRVLDMLTDIQMTSRYFRLPTQQTIVGATLELAADRLTLACMNGGDMNASSWALFHMRQPSIRFEPNAQYVYQEDNSIGVFVHQQLVIQIGQLSLMRDTTESTKAVVCRVMQQSRHVSMGARAAAQVDGGYLDYLIGSVLRQLFPDENNESGDTASTKTTKCTHSVLELFQ